MACWFGVDSHPRHVQSSLKRVEMNLLFIQPCYRDFGGFFRASYLARGLARMGHEVTLITPQLPNKAGVSRGWLEKGVEHIELPNVGPHFALAKFLRIPRIVAQVAKRRWDIVHICETVQPENLAAQIAGRLCGHTVVVDWYDFWTDGPIYEHSGGLVRTYLRWAEHWAPKLASGVVVISNYLEDAARALGCRHVLKIPIGVWSEQFSLWDRQAARASMGLPMDAPLFLAFGNTFLGGRGKLLMECFDQISTRLPDARLIVNIEPQVIWAENAPGCKPPPIDQRIMCVGQIPQQELGKYLGACDMVLFPTTDGRAERACFPTRVGSYLNGERPIITLRTDTEVSNLVERYNCGIVADSPRELAEKVMSSFAAPEKRLAMEDGARQAKAALAYPMLCARLLEFYKELGAGR